VAKAIVRLQAVQWALLAALAALLVRAAQVQLVQGRRWSAEAEARRTERKVLEARRGTLFDRHGTPLAVTLETYHVGVAPNELRAPARDAVTIARRLGREPAAVQRALRKRYAWFGGPFSASQVEPLRDVRGVHLEPVLHRFYPSPDLASAIIGRTGDLAPSGLERTLDTLLAGTAGAATVLRDRAGRDYESPSRVIAEPVPGHDVVLTIDAELQEIAQRALDDALARLDADGGDVLMLDPASGEVLAVASRQRRGGSRPSAFVDVFEPGSTAKIFAAAALLGGSRFSLRDRVSGENGSYKLPDREPIRDEHPMPSFNLAEAIQYSSNIAMAKFANRLQADDQFRVLRDFGFGTPTGIEYPAESPGRLRLPRDWTRLSAASLAMGYELAVTPLQLAAAYGALAHDGVLMRPTLIREIRRPDGSVRYRHRPEPVRRVVSSQTASRLRELLVGVVAGGTGSGAALTNFPLAAKTGTSRRFINGRYASGEYFASFAAIFPADAPQLVLVVKLDNPRKGSYFAAQTAAPVTRSMLEQALAARNVAIDRARLSTALPANAPAPLEDDGGVVPYVVGWPYHPDTTGGVERRAVPEVHGRSLRDAARRLHARGFRVSLRGWGVADHTWPAAGDSARVGATVTLFAGPER
jgi:cell division protein FtsI (penicillin-binding protein 3)